MCRIELALRLWLQGAEWTITGGSGSSKQAAIWAEFRQTFAWLQITAFGWPVEPEVSRYLARSVGLAVAAAGRAARRRPKGPSPGRAFLDAMTGRPVRLGAASPSAKSAASSV